MAGPPQCTTYFATSARTRQGLPEPLTIGSGAAKRTAPVVGSLSRLRSCVSPYLLLPRKSEWHGNGGSNPNAPPASVPTVSQPHPRISVFSARWRAASGVMPGVCGPF